MRRRLLFARDGSKAVIADINAGILGDIVPVADPNEEAWDHTIETSLKGILVVHEASDSASV